MGIFDKAARLWRYSESAGFGNDNSVNVVASPESWATGAGLAAVLGMDSTGQYALASEREALSVPPVVRALAQYTAAVAPMQLVADGGGTVPRWMNHTRDSITPGERLSDIVRDLMFHGSSLLWVQRNAGEITDALRLPHGIWSYDFLNRIVINGEPAADQSQFLLIKSYLPMGFLEYGADSIRHYRDIMGIIRNRGKNPIPLVELHIEQEYDGTAEDLKKLQTDWANARQAENGAVAFTPAGIKLNVHQPGNTDAEMLTAARNGVRLDVANFLNLDAGLVDGASGRSMDYENTLQSTSEFVRLSLPLFLEPIRQRLSQPDVMPEGQSVKFDTTILESVAVDAQGNTGTATTEGLSE